MSSYNAFTQAKTAGKGSVPVWLGVVSPRPVGGTLAEAFCKAGILIPAGAPIVFDEGGKKITPFYGWEVVSVDASTHAITVKVNDYGIVPATDDTISPVGAKFDTTGAAGKVAGVGVVADGKFVITFTDGKLDSVAAGTILTASAATGVAASGASIKYQPNAYLYSDICIEKEADGMSFESIAATGAAVDFHGEGLLVARVPYGELASQLKAAIPNVTLVGY